MQRTQDPLISALLESNSCSLLLPNGRLRFETRYVIVEFATVRGLPVVLNVQLHVFYPVEKRKQKTTLLQRQSFFPVCSYRCE